VTGETFEGVVARLRHLAPALLGRDPLDRSTAMRLLGSRLAGAPTAKAALDIALHDLAGRVARLPVWALLGGRAREALSISRIISPKSPEAMAMDAS
jgi:L-alanine-DL-glutamate epimerase-like enolase superfamily enzyme